MTPPIWFWVLVGFLIGPAGRLLYSWSLYCRRTWALWYRDLPWRERRALWHVRRGCHGLRNDDRVVLWRRMDGNWWLHVRTPGFIAPPDDLDD